MYKFSYSELIEKGSLELTRNKNVRNSGTEALLKGNSFARRINFPKKIIPFIINFKMCAFAYHECTHINLPGDVTTMIRFQIALLNTKSSSVK